MAQLAAREGLDVESYRAKSIDELREDVARQGGDASLVTLGSLSKVFASEFTESVLGQLQSDFGDLFMAEAMELAAVRIEEDLRAQLGPGGLLASGVAAADYKKWIAPVHYLHYLHLGLLQLVSPSTKFPIAPSNGTQPVSDAVSLANALGAIGSYLVAELPDEYVLTKLWSQPAENKNAPIQLFAGDSIVDAQPRKNRFTS